jgi:hypothetical protein
MLLNEWNSYVLLTKQMLKQILRLELLEFLHVSLGLLVKGRVRFPKRTRRRSCSVIAAVGEFLLGAAMRFVSRVRFRWLGCEITEVCEITGNRPHLTGMNSYFSPMCGGNRVYSAELTAVGVEPHLYT